MKWNELIKYSSVQLRKFDETGALSGVGSGCLFDLKSQRYLLTVFHVTKRSSGWTAQIKFNDEKQATEILHLNSFSYFANNAKISNEFEEVEFAFHPVNPDFKSYYHNRNYKGETLELVERPVFTPADISEPNANTDYGFSGDIKPVVFPDMNSIETTQHIYHGLEYDRLENDMYCFKLPEEHPGHDMFQGCSGAPIIGEDGKLVSLVNSGCTKKNELYGCNLSKCIRSIAYYLK